MRTAALLLLGSTLAGTFAVTGCSGADEDTGEATSEVGACADVSPDTFRFSHGDDDGHADPLGAVAAHQARAGRVKAGDIVQAADARHKVRPGDFVLANDKVAVYIEDVGRSDGYFPFGGEILSLDKIGANGRPQGLSHYGETVLMFGLQTIAPDKVTVLADGSDGGPAIVRASGILKLIPSLDAFLMLFPDQYGFAAAVDYILEPGASKVTLRYSVANSRNQAVSFTTRSHLGVFQSSWSQTFAENGGFGKVTGQKPFIAWEQGDASFLVRPRNGKLQTFLATNGLEAYQAPTIPLQACEKKTVEYADLVIGGPGIDGLLEAKRAAFGEAPWREVHGVVRENGGGPLAGAMVHATGNTGYLTRAVADAEGKYTIHVPPTGAVNLTATAKGWAVPSARPLAATESDVDLTLPKRATIEVTTTDADTDEALPVRIQIIPDAPYAKAPASFGLKADEPDDRLYREYAISGKLSVPVPPGGYRVVVTRGFEYELFDAPVLAEEGKTATVTAKLRHSVATPDSMCADFHIHSAYSVDSDDPVLRKVEASLADGLEIPVSSEHEYIIDFQPIIEQLGMTKWAFGVPSEELTTFKYGHFGVFPLVPQPDQTNNGAIDWTYQTPATILPSVEELASKPLLIVNHPRGSMGYLDQAGYDPARGKGQDGLWSDAFHALEVFNDSDFEASRESTVADWFGMLNAGRKMAATGASDSHHLSTNPVGYPSTCLRFGHDDPRQLTANAIRDALRNGAAVVNGGITLAAEGPDGTTPGGDSTAGAYKVSVSSPSWIRPSSVEVIVDGKTTQTIALDPNAAGSGPGKRWELSIPVAPVESRPRHWVVFHVKGDGDLAPLHPGRKPFAVSNPIYF
ncbi:MAG: carboxypeptidase regulatory-like domain-containing protein [Labilithrix sp.]|nr:carboxypeptidase regulatory-like domain-containing protein [Labilithrix sp.]MCW5817128.1 carboxypeptidase regulatory-like domain-containing protein [Labilithrix sp.]